MFSSWILRNTPSSEGPEHSHLSYNKFKLCSYPTLNLPGPQYSLKKQDRKRQVNFSTSENKNKYFAFLIKVVFVVL